MILSFGYLELINCLTWHCGKEVVLGNCPIASDYGTALSKELFKVKSIPKDENQVMKGNLLLQCQNIPL